MLVLDAHCDAITKIMETKESLYQNSNQVDIQRMKKYGGFIQFFAAFIEPPYGHAYAMRRAVQIIDKYYTQLEEYASHISHCGNYEEMMRAVNEGKIAAVLSIEGGEALQGEISALRIFYRLGVRSICLTWNYRNEIADGVADAASGGGLTPFGREVIREMNRLGMLVDVSHLAPKGFWDVLETATVPIIASHSNSKKVCSHRRNLTDEQILALRDNGGVMGINLYPYFLNGTDQASLSDAVRHIEHITALVGCDHLGLGADFDGIEVTPKDMKGVQDIEILLNELLRLNYPEESIEKLAGLNFLRVIKKVLK